MNFAVILNYMNYEQTINCVKIVNKTNMKAIILIDNGSTNDSFNLLENEFSKDKCIIVLKSEYNLGYAAGNNIGFKYIRQKFGLSNENVVFVINPDSCVSSKVISSISDFIISHKDSGVVSCLSNHKSSSWRHMQLYRAFIFNSFILNWALLKINISENRYYRLKSNSPRAMKVDVVSGALFGISQMKLEDINYFDEGTFLYFEEEALYSKLAEKGYQNFMITDVSYQHFGGTSTSESTSKLKIIGSQSRMYVAKKYYGANSLYLSICSLINNLDYRILRIMKK